MKVFFALLFTFLLAQTGLSQSNCRFVADVVFVLDESGSVGLTNFNKIKQLTNQIIDMLDVDSAKRATRVGVVTYGRIASQNSAPFTVDVPFAKYSDKTDLKKKVSGIQYSGNGTPLGPGLREGWVELTRGITGGSVGPRLGPNNPPEAQIDRIIFLFGDGMPNIGGNGAQVTNLAQRIKTGTFDGSTNENTWGTRAQSSPMPFPVRIFSYFVGSGKAGPALFRNLASVPTSEWFVNSPDFQAIDAPEITRQFCGSVVNGDVHYTTSDGLMYTFNGAGDYIYLRTEDKIEMHVRAVLIGQASAVAALAIQDKRVDTVLEVWWDGKASERIRVNIRHSGEKLNKEIENITTQTKIVETFYLQLLSPGVMEIRVMGYTGFSVMINYGGRAGFSVKVPKTWNTEGLNGNNNGDFKDDLCNRNGHCLPVNATNDEQIHNVIGLDWAVLPSELLFEKWMPTSDHDLRYHPLIYSAQELVKAKELCGDDQPCIYDFISTGSAEYAKLTKQDNRHMSYVYAGDHFYDHL